LQKVFDFGQATLVRNQLLKGNMHDLVTGARDHPAGIGGNSREKTIISNGMIDEWHRQNSSV
jgi:hypothetical protein